MPAAILSHGSDSKSSQTLTKNFTTSTTVFVPHQKA